MLTEKGKPWVRDFIREDGGHSKAEMIQTNYVRIQKKTETKYPLMWMRKTSAALIDNKYDDRISSLFLGHSPQSVKERFYAQPAEEILDEALDWLIGQYFQA